MTEHVRRTRRKRRVKRSRSERRAFTPARIAICAIALVAGFTFGFALLPYGPHAYRNWRESNFLKRASAMLAKEDFDGATREARAALALHRDSLAALYVLAEASEKQNRPETIAWRAQIAHLEPENLDSQ